MSQQIFALPGRGRALVPGLAGLALGVFALGPALGRGYVLAYDMVFLPDPPPTRAMVGLGGSFPRQVPSDAAAAGLAWLLPGDVAQKLILLFVFAFAAWGVARLVPSDALLPRTAAAVMYGWNPFVAERLLIGQWALLLGYAGLPWALAAAVRLREQAPADLCRSVLRPAGLFGLAGRWKDLLGSVARLAFALLPAAVGGFAALSVSALVVIATVRRWAALAVVAGLAVPWAVPALMAGGRTDPSGVDLFAARADTPFGALGSLLSLGGSWNAETVPAGYSAWPAALGRLVLVAAAVWAAWRARERAEIQGLLGAAGVGLAIASVGISPAGRAALRRLIGLWPGFGVLRDAQVYVAPLALLAAVGLGLLVARIMSGPGDRVGRGALAVILVVAPVALLPGLGWGAGGRLVAVQYPADWGRMRSIINGDPAPGRVLALPWGTYRRFAWNGGRTVLDPLPRTVRRQVVQADGLRVGDRALHAEAPLARQAARLLQAPGPLPAELAAAGYRYAVVEKVSGPEEGDLRKRLAGATVVLDGPDLVVYRLSGTRASAALSFYRTALVVSGDALTLALVLWAISVIMRRTGHQGGSPPCAS